jgi:hypothetical protein
MAAIRHNLYQDVRHVVSTAEHIADWTRYVGKYPWLALGLACGVGYFLVPRKKRQVLSVDVSSIPEAVKSASAFVTEAGKDQALKSKEKSGLIGAAFGLLAPLAVRAVQGYALKYLENWIAQHHVFQAGPASHPGGTPRDVRPRTMNP